MSETQFPEPDTAVEATPAAELKRRIDAGEDVTVLDTRAVADYEAWHVDGPSVTTANVPYFEFLEGLDGDLLDRVPDDENLVTVCAKGKSSEYVAGLLNDTGYEATNLADGMRGWARLYEHADVELDSGTVLRQYRRPSSGCLAYMVVSGDEASLIDPLRSFTGRYVADAADLGVEIVAVLDTHVHADHVSGVRELAERTGATVTLPGPAVERGVAYDVPFETVADGDEVTVGDATISVRHTPGHTSGMTSYLVDDEVLATGDTLFVDGVARPDLEAGDEGAADAAERLHRTLHERILPLADDTLVAPAHFGESTAPRGDGAYLARLGDLRRNLHLLSLDREAFVDRVLADMPPRPANYEEIIATNLGRSDVDDETAFELELGPNNCAAGP